MRSVIVGAFFVLSMTAGAVWPAPVTRTLEDFEGKLVGWAKGAALSEDATQGAKALRWTLDAKPGPKFYHFDFSDRGIEVAEWDRLIFDYKFEQPGCNWWGVKVIDYPLGDGMQATWQIGDKRSITPGQWQTAVIDLQQPQWLWGDKPNKTIQQIHFRCQFDKDKTSPILIDNIRIEQDALRIEKVEREEPAREGDTLSVIYKITLANAQPEPAQLQLSARDASDKLNVTLQSDEVTIPARDKRAVFVQLSTSLAGEDAASPLSVLSTEFVAKVKDMDDPEKTAALRLAVPLGQIPHPSLLITREQAKEILKRVETSDETKAIYESLKKGADGWLSKTPDFPDRGGQWWHWYTCKKCGARLKTKSPTEHACPDCGEVYSGWPYDDVVLDRLHNALAGAIRDLGLMYVFTGKDAYAAKAREILMGYAERYLNYPLHNIHGEPKRGGGHVGPQSLDESTWLIPVAQGFDCVYDTLSEGDIKFIAEKMLLPAAELIHDHQWGIHNICCWHDSAYGLVGLTLANEQLAGDAISGPKGFRAQIEEGVTDDGFWYESAWGYHFYTMMALQPLAIAARNVGIDLYTERYKSMYDAPLAFMGPGGVLPAFNDSGTANVLGYGAMYEVAYARWGDPRHLLPIMRTGRKSLETLLFGAKLGEAEEFELGSRVFPAAGYVILRSGEVGAGAERHLPENYLAFDYGPHGGGHGHPDKLGFVLYGKRALLAEDPGCIAYGNPAHGGWFRQTVSHSTVVVNGESQKPCTGTLQFAAFGDDISLCSARADDAYPGVKLRRTLALIGDRVIDVFLCEAEEEATFDWVYHNRGILETSLPLAGLDAIPEGNGYDWAKQWREAVAESAWSAVWRQEKGPGLVLAQAEAKQPRHVLSAIGMGNPTRVKVPVVISRQRGKVALYCSGLEVFEGAAPPELSVRVLDVERSAGDGAGEQPVALEVVGGGVRDVLLINPGGGSLKVGEYELEGEGAALRYRGDKIEKLLVVGDGQVRVRGETVTSQS